MKIKNKLFQVFNSSKKLRKFIPQFNLRDYKLQAALKFHWPIILLTIIGAILRLYNFRSTLMFLGDQARDVDIVRYFIKTFDPIIVGPTTSVGKIQLGPFYYYFMAPFLLLSNFDPIGPALAVAFLGIITIPTLYFIALKMFNKTTAFIASIIFTFSNVIIASARFSWNPNPMPFVITLLIYFIYQVYQEKKYKSIIGIFTCFAIALQLHYMILLILPSLIILMFLILKEIYQDPKTLKEFKKYFLWGCFIFFLFQIPLIVFDLMKNFLNTKGFLEFFQKGHHTSKLSQISPRISQRIKETIGLIIGLELKTRIADFASYFSFVAAIAYSYLNRKSKSVQIISIIFITSILGLILYSGDLYEHYIAFLFPISAIFIAMFLTPVLNKKIIKVIPVVLLLILISNNLRNYRWLKSLGWTIDDSKNISSIIASDLVKDQPYNIVLIDDTKDYRAMQYRYFLYNTKINDYGDFKVDTLYLISQWDIDNLESIEVRELEEFFDTRLLKMTKEENADFLKLHRTKEWKIIDGPYIYKLTK